MRKLAFILLLLFGSSFIEEFSPLSSVHAQLPPGNSSTISLSTEATHRGIQLELKRVDLLEELPDGTKPRGDYFVVIFGALTNSGNETNCVYKSDFRLINNGMLFTLSRKHKSASKVYEIEYPSAARGQCISVGEKSDSLLLFDSGESSAQAAPSSVKPSIQVDSAVLLFGSELMVIPTLNELILAATEQAEDGDLAGDPADSAVSSEPVAEESTAKVVVVEQQSQREIPTATNTSTATSTSTPTATQTPAPTSTNTAEPGAANTLGPTWISTPTTVATPLAKQALFETTASSTVDEGIVTQVISGMQVEVEVNGENVIVCYLGIKAPASGEAYFEESYAANISLVLGASVYLYHDDASQSTTDCLQRYVYLADGMFVNEAIVKQGWATTTEEMNGVIYSRNLKDAERLAQESRLGVWDPDSVAASISPTPLATSSPTADVPTATATPTASKVPTLEPTATATETIEPTPVPPTVQPTATATETVEPTPVPPTVQPTTTATETVEPTPVPPTVQPTATATVLSRAATQLIGPSITPVRPTPVSTVQIQLSTP